jgi:glutamyl-tRNA synthetase
MWLNAEHLRALPIDELARQLLPFAQAAGLKADPATMIKVAPLIRERIKTLKEVDTVADFFFVDQLAPYDRTELIPQKGDLEMARRSLEKAREILPGAEFNHDGLKLALEGGAASLKIKNGQMYQPIRVAVCGRKNAPPLFETLEVLGRETCLYRIRQALDLISL